MFFLEKNSLVKFGTSFPQTPMEKEEDEEEREEDEDGSMSKERDDNDNDNDNGPMIINQNIEQFTGLKGHRKNESQNDVFLAETIGFKDIASLKNHTSNDSINNINQPLHTNVSQFVNDISIDPLEYESGFHLFLFFFLFFFNFFFCLFFCVGLTQGVAK